MSFVRKWLQESEAQNAWAAPLPASVLGALLVTTALIFIDFLGWIGECNQWLGAHLAFGGIEYKHELPSWLLWTASVLIELGLISVISSLEESWRKYFIWIGTVLVTALWSVVCCVALCKPDVALPLLAAMFSGLYACCILTNCDNSAKAEKE